MVRYIVRERADGRGGLRPFNSYTSAQKGATVQIGDKNYAVTSDGRVNIPKSVMQKYGIKGDDGRLRIAMQFSADGGNDGWKKAAAQVMTPPIEYKNAEQGAVIKKAYIATHKLKPRDSPDFTWSPI